jgi:hypothetical protein
MNGFKNLRGAFANKSSAMWTSDAYLRLFMRVQV